MVVVVVAIGIIALSGQHGGTGGSPGAAAAAGTSSAAAAGQTGTAKLVGSLSAPGNGQMRAAFFSLDGNYIVVASGKADIYIFNAKTLKLVKTLSVSAGDKAYPWAFSPDDKTLYVSDGATFIVSALDIATGKVVNAYRIHDGPALGYSDGGSVYGIEATAITVNEYEIATDKAYAQVTVPGTAPVATGGVDPDGDGKDILISETDGMSYLVDVRSNQVVGTFRYPYSGASTLYPELSLDGNTVYVPAKSTPAKLWDVATGSYITPTDARWPTLDSGVTFSVDGRFALTQPLTGQEAVDLWNIATRAHVLTVAMPGGASNELEGIGPGAKELLSAVDLMSNETFTKLDIWAVPG